MTSNQPLGRFINELLRQKHDKGLEKCDLLIVNDNASSLTASQVAGTCEKMRLKGSCCSVPAPTVDRSQTAASLDKKNLPLTRPRMVLRVTTNSDDVCPIEHHDNADHEHNAMTSIFHATGSCTGELPVEPSLFCDSTLTGCTRSQYDDVRPGVSIVLEAQPMHRLSISLTCRSRS